MQVETGNGRAHVAIALRALGAETWPDLFGTLKERIPSLRHAIGGNELLGLSLQIPALAAFELYDRANLVDLQMLLDEHGCYVFSLDGCGFGSRGMPADSRWGRHFPDWHDMRRMAYSNVLADILVQLLPEDLEYGSISTLPVAGRDAIAPGEIPAAARNILRLTAYLAFLRQNTGKTVKIALQPTPCCLIETAAEAARFFGDYLYSPIALAHFSSAAGVTASDAHHHLRAHLGVCLDSSHMACMFETPQAALDTLTGAAVPIAKLVIANALATGDAALTRRLPGDGALADCAVVRRVGDDLKCFPDLQSVAASPADRDSAPSQWRIACHAPVSQDVIAPFDTTQSVTVELLQSHGAKPITTHLELSVDSLAEGKALTATRQLRELNWLLNVLGHGRGNSDESGKPRRRRLTKLELAGQTR